ncbi:MAG: hypothetical protein EBR62_08435, partial [Verrucomicrobia bacterium]|nr:hypothetical protein [Verrucomicrobiota bacterium]
MILLRRSLAGLDDGLGFGGEDALVDVADGDDLDALLGHQLAHVATALALEADAGKLEAIGRSDGAVLAERRRWDDGREAEREAGEGGVAQEGAAVETWGGHGEGDRG